MYKFNSNQGTPPFRGRKGKSPFRGRTFKPRKYPFNFSRPPSLLYYYFASRILRSRGSSAISRHHHVYVSISQ